MPWAHGQDYSKQKNAELKHLLQLRNLPHSGTKSKMVSRLIAHDSVHPFPFKELPPELRNEIYKLVAVSEDTFHFEHLDQRLIGHTEGIHLKHDFLSVQLQSAIFRVSTQTRAEGLALFYQHHHFRLSVEHGGCFLAILKWLRNIGSVYRKNIRHLEIRYRTRSSVLDASLIGRVGGYLSDKATVVYSAESLSLVRSLWKTRQYLWSKGPTTAPSFRLYGICYYRGVIDENQDTLPDRPIWQSYAHVPFLEGSMTFHPRASIVQSKGQSKASHQIEV